MELSGIAEKDKAYYMNTFGARTSVCFESGKGMELYSEEGKTYLDFFSGIGVNNLGHCHDRVTAAICDQARALVHTSNLYYIKNQTLLAEELVKSSCADKIFFANTGAEANEGALKLARMYFYRQGKPRHKLVTLENSFHGRTLATVAATGQTKYQKPYEPLLPGFTHVPVNDCGALSAAVDGETCAVILEIIQGESGARPLSKEFLALARELCDKHGCLLIVDEVQTGMGRTGSLFAYEQSGIEPDIFTLAKALGGGIPIGAVCAKAFAAQAFEPGDHGTTFGGNPLATRAGLEVLKVMDEENILENTRTMGEYFLNKLNNLKTEKIAEIRGKGLMIGVEFNGDIAVKVKKLLFEAGYLTGAVGKTLRILPPLIITQEKIDGFVGVLSNILNGVVEE